MQAQWPGTCPGNARRAAVAARGTAAGVAVALLAACSAQAPAVIAVPTGGAPGVRSYVLNNVFVAAAPDEPGACPQLSIGSPELFRATLPPEEQKRYATEDRREALGKLMAERIGFRRAVVPPDPQTKRVGPEQVAATRAKLGIPEGKGGLNFLGKVVAYDSCTNPEDFPQLKAGLQPYLGKQAPGMNLDGRVDGSDFAGADGAAGVDNELWRVFGCVWAFRENGDPKVAAGMLSSVRAPTLVEVSGLDDERNDADVQVAIYTGTTTLTADAAGRPLARASFDVDPDPRLQARVRGRIADGVLVTDTFDVNLSYKEQIIDTVRNLRGARLRATLKPDGTIEGGFHGYYAVASAWDSIRQMTEQGAAVSGFACPAIYAALREHADGIPDPASGRNTAISASFAFVGVRAHVIHPAAAPLIAANGR